MFSQLIKLIRILSSETDPIQISLGFSLAMIAGFTPIFSLHNILVIFCLLLFRINIATFMLSLLLFSGIAYLLDPVFQDVGRTILTHADLSAFFTELYNQPFWRLTNFNNTLVMGSLTISLLAFLPSVLLSNHLVKRYRSHVLLYVQRSALFRFIKTSKLFSRAISLAE